jgi:hypothetical protein
MSLDHRKQLLKDNPAAQAGTSIAEVNRIRKQVSVEGHVARDIDESHSMSRSILDEHAILEFG